MVKINTRPSQLWDQWLQKLHGIEDPQKKYFRLELLQLLVKYEKPVGEKVDPIQIRVSKLKKEAQ